MELVSIGVPVYNGEKYLRESLDSIVNQTYKNLEILIVDDQSSDGSMAIAEEYQAKDDRIRIVRNEQNLGLVGNWNKCIDESSGEYLKLHFQDDMMQDDTIEKMIGLAKKEDVDVVLSDREYRFENEKKGFYIDTLKRVSHYIEENAVIEPSFFEKLLEEIGIGMNYIGEPILGLINSKVFEKWGIYDDSLKQICDFEYWLRLGLNMNIGFIPEPLHVFRLHNDSQGAKNAREIRINPSHIDRILFAAKLVNSDYYANLRKSKGESFVNKILVHYVNLYIRKYGRSMLAEHIDERYFEYYVPETFWEKLKFFLRKR